MATDRALVMDVDGVVAPVHGKTAWGDDVVAGRLFGPVLVSPTLCARLDEHPEITTLVWCDDHLTRTRRATIRPRLEERGIRNLLLTPATSVGLTPQHLVKVAAMLGV